jgi:hypothetical protein
MRSVRCVCSLDAFLCTKSGVAGGKSLDHGVEVLRLAIVRARAVANQRAFVSVLQKAAVENSRGTPLCGCIKYS